MRQRVLQALALQKRLCRIVRPHGACACGASCAEMQAAFVLSMRSPHPSRYSLDTFSRLGEGFYSCALSSCETALPCKCTPLCPRGTLIADQRRAGKARPRGKAGNERRKACFHPGGSGFSLPRGKRVAKATPSLTQRLSRQNRFLGTFLTQESTVPLVLPSPRSPPQSSSRMPRC